MNDNIIDFRTRRPVDERSPELMVTERPSGLLVPEPTLYLPNPLRVAIIEDDPVRADMLRMMLKRGGGRFGVAVVTQWATSTEDAFELIPGWNPHVMFHDLGLPGWITQSDTDTIPGFVNVKLAKDLKEICDPTTIHIVNTRRFERETSGPLRALGPHAHLEADHTESLNEEDLFQLVAQLVKNPQSRRYSPSVYESLAAWDDEAALAAGEEPRPVVLYKPATKDAALDRALRSGDESELGSAVKTQMQSDFGKLRGFPEFTVFTYARLNSAILVGLVRGRAVHAPAERRAVSLTPTERKILDAMLPLKHPDNYRALASQVGIKTEATVRKHIEHVRSKLAEAGVLHEAPADYPSLARWLLQDEPADIELGEKKIVQFNLSPAGQRMAA